MSGIAFPEDFGLPETEEKIKDAFLKTNLWALDVWDGEFEHNGKNGYDVFYVRPRLKNAKEKLIDRSWGGECINLTESGCSLTFENRPTICRQLVPSKNYPYCKPEGEGFTKEDCVAVWIPYQELLEKIIDEHREINNHHSGNAK